MKSSRILRTLVFVVFLISQFFIVTNSSRFVITAFACNTWQVGTRIGLRGGSEIRTGSGLNYQVHTIVPEDNWQVDIIGGPRNADGKEWWDISRQNLDGGGTGWVYKEQAGYDLCNDTPSNPGQIELMDNLSLWSDGSGQWPPVVGDKVVAHIKVRNSGGETLSLGKIGVRGRKNGGEFWDIGWWSADLGAGQEWQLDPNNERPLEAGNYSFRISYQDNSGWHEIGNEINFSVSASVPSNPGQLELMDNLSLWSDGSGQWPPVVGDKLVTHIKVRNGGGETLSLGKIGVRGRKNGGEFWDIGWWSADLGAGQEWQLDPNNERPLEAGNYSFRISYQDNSGWHEIGNEINFSVSASVPSNPGQLKLMDNLSLWSDGSGQWPPVVGDKLFAHIKVRNNGGEEIILEHIGVRGRKNGNKNWDIGWWSADLGAGQEWQLDPNNERPLEAGNYSFRISYQDNSGWHEIGNEINFSVGVVPATPEEAASTEAPVPNQPEEPNSYSSGDWQTGARVGLCAGAPIRSGSGFSYPTHTIVPENNWQVDIIEGPRNNGGVTWWNVSRANIDGGGTGWIFYEQAGNCDKDRPEDSNPNGSPTDIPETDNSGEQIIEEELQNPKYCDFWIIGLFLCPPKVNAAELEVNLTCKPQCVAEAKKHRPDIIDWSTGGTAENILRDAKNNPTKVGVRSESEDPQSGDLVVWSSACGWNGGGHIGYVEDYRNGFIYVTDSNWGTPVGESSCYLRNKAKILKKDCMSFITKPIAVEKPLQQQLEPTIQQPISKCSQYKGLRWLWCQITGK